MLDLSYYVLQVKLPVYDLCHSVVTLVPRAWHGCAKGVAQLCQRRGTDIG